MRLQQISDNNSLIKQWADIMKQLESQCVKVTGEKKTDLRYLLIKLESIIPTTFHNLITIKCKPISVNYYKDHPITVHLQSIMANFTKHCAN